MRRFAYTMTVVIFIPVGEMICWFSLFQENQQIIWRISMHFL